MATRSHTPDPRAVNQELLTVKQAAQLCGVSTRTLTRWGLSGVAPSPVKLGYGTRTAVRYRQAELLSWIEAGCPEMKTWTWDGRDSK